MDKDKYPRWREIFRLKTSVRLKLLHALALGIGLSAAALILHIFALEHLPSGSPTKFSITTVDGKALANKQSTPIRLTTGDYRLEIDSPAQKALLISDKNVRIFQNREIANQVTQTSAGVLWRPTVNNAKIRFSTIGISNVAVSELSEQDTETLISAPRVVSALFASGLAVMCFYAALVGLLSNLRVFSFFSGWVWSTLALGSITAGYDLIWFGPLPQSAIEEGLKQLLISLWGVSSTLLFLELFKNNAALEKIKPLFNRVLYASIGMLMIAPVCPGKFFMPLYWAVAATSLVVSAYGLSSLLARSQRLSAVWWYGLGWALQISGMLYEVAAASKLVPKLATPLIVPCGLIATFFIGTAVVDVLNQERRGRAIALSIAEKARKQLSMLFNSSPAGLMRYGNDGSLVEFNTKSQMLLGTDFSRVSNLSELLSLQSIEGSSSSITSVSDLANRTITIRRRDGQIQKTLSVRFSRQDDSTDVAIVDNTAQDRLATVMQEQALTDPLTGARNRRALQQDIQRVHEDPIQHDMHTMFFIDVAGFGDINSYFGQMAGDTVLQSIATKLRRQCPDMQVYRLAADQFVALGIISGCSEEERLEVIVQQVKSNPIDYGKSSIFIELTCASISVRNSLTSDAALAIGRHLIRVLRLQSEDYKHFKPTDTQIVEWVNIQEHTEAIRNGSWKERIELYAQPLVSLNRQSGCRFELLMRVRNGQRSEPPQLFLRAAESLGYMSEIDFHVMQEALAWIEKYPSELAYVTANLSGASVSDQHFTTRLKDLLFQHKAASRHLCIEVTESVAVRDLEGAASFFRELATLGVKIALDDFGQGYTNFNYLTALPAQVVKLDGSLVQDLLSSSRHRAIIQCLADLAHGLGMACVAEWVENAEVAAVLSEMGIDFGQGWYFSKPMPLWHWLNAPFPTFERQEQRRSNSAVGSLAKLTSDS